MYKSIFTIVFAFKVMAGLCVAAIIAAAFCTVEDPTLFPRLLLWIFVAIVSVLYIGSVVLCYMRRMRCDD